MSRFPIIGLTGGIASGKSTVAHMMSKMGWNIVDADLIAREVVKPGTQGLEKVIRAFGSKFLQPDGALNRRALGEVVFADPTAKLLLNNITHGLISQRVWADIEALPDNTKGVVYDCPLLIESGNLERYDAVWVVTAPVRERIARILQRDGLSEEQARKRIASQCGDEERECQATKVLRSNDTLASQVILAEMEFWKRWRSC